jgi:alanyl-tRNA synthetase
MGSQEIRKRFLDFFEKRGHIVVPSSSLVSDDPSVLLTTAGMQQFKPYYIGKADPEKDFGSRRTTSVQKSFRTSDIDSVGDESHLTFFEMLGNFSFGPVGGDEPDDFGTSGYFKKAAIHWAYSFLTEELKIKNEELKITVFSGDDKTPFDEESYRIWKDEIGIPADRIRKCGREDNFWGPTGKEGPCGPTTEIYINGLEIWNIVFNEYYCLPNGTLEKLKNPGVDTGMGLERLAMAVQNKPTIFETDLFKPLIDLLLKDLPERLKRLIADHLRGSFFIIEDGVLPSNKEAGYILRRLLRKVIRYEKNYGFSEEFYRNILEKVVEIYKDTYKFDKEKILEVLFEEREKFLKTLARGLKEFEKMKTRGISGQEAFYLYETFGFPFDLTKDLAKEEGIQISEEGFKRALEAHQQISRLGAEKKFGGLRAEAGEREIRLHTATHLLQAALRRVLGEEVRQMGSDINPERTRFDFSFSRKLNQEELKKVEDMVNEVIKNNFPVIMREMSYEEAIKSGALHFFKEKYPGRVKVYIIADIPGKEIFSSEICGGPHVKETGEIGRFKILKEESVASGIRRIRATVE